MASYRERLHRVGYSIHVYRGLLQVSGSYIEIPIEFYLDIFLTTTVIQSKKAKIFSFLDFCVC